jgi:predicted RNA-binding Zn ribbon-like protein
MVNSEQGLPTDFAPVETMDLAGGHVALDFVNTASGRSVGPLREKLVTYPDLVTFAERVEIVDERQGRRLRKSASDSPRRAEAVLERAHALREAVYRVFTGSDASGDDLALVSKEAGLAAAQRHLAGSSGGYTYAWPKTDDPERVLWPVALAAAELLTSSERERVKECAADNCNWLFLDMSRNRSRRWCDMKVCGNRAKARRFSERHGGASA